jgi:hypothetical protein
LPQPKPTTTLKLAIALTALSFTPDSLKSQQQVTHLFLTLGCCGFEEDDPENNWVNKTNLGVYCDVRLQPAATVPLGRIKWM